MKNAMITPMKVKLRRAAHEVADPRWLVDDGELPEDDPVTEVEADDPVLPESKVDVTTAKVGDNEAVAVPVSTSKYVPANKLPRPLSLT